MAKKHIEVSRKYKNKNFSLVDLFKHLLEQTSSKEFKKINQEKLKSFLNTLDVEEQSIISEKIRQKIREEQTFEEKNRIMLLLLILLENQRSKLIIL